MNIEKAKQIAVANILNAMGHQAQKTTATELWYLSPFRNEKTASFHVTIAKNLWHDFGDGKGGDGIALVCEHLKQQYEDHTVADALRWLRNMSGYTIADQLNLGTKEEEPSNWILKKVKPIQSPALIAYLKARGIGLTLAEKHLEEVYVRHATKPMGIFALGFKNEDEGYELRNPFLKSCVKPKNITFIRADAPKPKGINIFEGVMDFLAAATRYPDIVLKNDTITLNSASIVERAFPYISGYGYEVIYNWTDNDQAGLVASKKIKAFAETQDDLKHKPMNAIYSPYKDVNEWHVQTLIL